MSQEKVREILSHVDMTKIDLSSFRISEKKFNEVANLYRNRLIISCVGIMLEKDKCSEDEVKGAFELMTDIVDNPTKYEYASVYADARKTTDKVIDDMLLNRDRTVNDVKVKSIERCVKSKYKSMRTSIETCLDAGITFEEELNEELVARCLRIATNAINNSRGNTKETQKQEEVVSDDTTVLPDPEPIEVPMTEIDTDQTNSVFADKHEVTTEYAIVDKPESATEHVMESNPTARKEKLSFWKRMFSRT